MDGIMLKNMNKTKRSNLITYAIVIVAFVVMQILSSTGSISSLLTGLLVPLCTYIILAVSLNLVVGILGELSLGHAGFMCVGAFSSANIYFPFEMMQHLVALLSIIYCKKHLCCRFGFVGVGITISIPGFVLFYGFGIQIR